MHWFPEISRLLLQRPKPERRKLKAGWTRISEALGDRLPELCRLLLPSPQTACLQSWQHIIRKDLKAILQNADPGDVAMLLPCTEYTPGCSMDDIVRAVLVISGPARALEVLIRGLLIRMESDGDRMCFRTGGFQANMDQALPWHWGSTRTDILARPPEELAALAAEVAPFRDACTLSERCVLSWLLPTDTGGAAETARRSLAEPVACFMEPLLLTADLPPDLALAVWSRADDHAAVRYAPELARLLAHAARAPLEALLSRLLALPVAPGLDPLLLALALYPESARTFAPLLDHPACAAVAEAFFERHPDQAALHLADSLSLRTQKAQRAAALLTGLTRLHPAAIRRVLPELDPRNAARLQRILDMDEQEADPDELPLILRAPPWRPAPDAPDIWVDLPVFEDRPVDELTLHALLNRNRAADNDAYFTGKRDRVRQIADIALTKNPHRGPAIALLRYLHGIDPQTLSHLHPRDKQAVLRCFDMDMLLECPSQAAKLPAFLVAKGLPRPHLRSGPALPLAAVDVLLEMLSFSPRFPAYIGLIAIREACDPASLDAFCWALAMEWVDHGMATPHGWMFLAMGHLGSDGIPRRLTPWIRKKLREGQSAAAMIGVEVLGMIPRDIALLHLGSLSRGSGPIERRAQELIQKLARIQNLDPEELEERLIPDLDLDPDGGCALDFGPRRFEVRFDEHLVPQIFDPDTRERLRALPRPARTDDPAKAAAAAERWKGLKADARTVTTQIRRRLERAMLERRLWKRGAFRTLFLQHPLLSLVARRLLWGQWEGGRYRPFRIAEDGSFADSDDQTLSLPDYARIGVPHPLELPDLSRWQEIIGDYGIMQPFPQAGRECFRPSPDEQNRQILPDLPELSVPWGKLRGALEHRGWTLKLGRNVHFERRFRDGVATISLGENPIGQPGDAEIPVGPVLFSDRIRNLSPVIYSETRRDMLMFTS